jgi:hypothetical protein
MRDKKIKELLPQRNHLCLHYENCLEAAAIKNLSELQCRGCQYEHDQSGRQKFRDYIEGSWALLQALFYPHNKQPEEDRAYNLLMKYYSPSADIETANYGITERSPESDEE